MLLVSSVELAVKVTVKFAVSLGSSCKIVRLPWIEVVSPKLPTVLLVLKVRGSPPQMKGSAAIRTYAEFFTSQVIITCSPGHANCLPSSSTLNERFTTTFEMGGHVSVHVKEEIKQSVQ